MPLKLQHLHLPGPIPYARAQHLQETLVARLLAHKAHPRTVPAPPPTILTTEFHPVYTCGRREHATVSPRQESHLRASGADFALALRGGQTTFHGPGQLVAYPVLDLRRHALGPRAYICALEGAVIATLAAYGVRGVRTEHPGVWVDAEHKICALGVHLRRFVSSHGIGLNVGMEKAWWERIVACGLEGKRVTSLEREGVSGVGVEEVGREFVGRMAERLEGVEGVEVVDAEVVEKLERDGA